MPFMDHSCTSSVVAFPGSSALTSYGASCIGRRCTDATGFQPSFTHPDAAEAGRGESASHVNVELSACVRALKFDQGRTARNYCKPEP